MVERREPHPTPVHQHHRRDGRPAPFWLAVYRCRDMGKLARLSQAPVRPGDVRCGTRGLPRCTQRDAPDPRGYNEAWLICGRRSGKSRMLSTAAVYLATLYCDWRKYLATGERAKIMVVSQDRGQAKVVLDYSKACCTGADAGAADRERDRPSISLTNSTVIEVNAASMRSTRGFTLVGAILDELAFFPVDEASAEPDVEIFNAIRPGSRQRAGKHPAVRQLSAFAPWGAVGCLQEALRRRRQQGVVLAGRDANYEPELPAGDG